MRAIAAVATFLMLGHWASPGPATGADPRDALLPYEWVGNIDQIDFNEPSGIVYHRTRGTLVVAGDNGDLINAYLARPLGPGPFPAMVLAHHMPGWDEWYRETTHKFAYHGYITISPNLYFRSGHGTA